MLSADSNCVVLNITDTAEQHGESGITAYIILIVKLVLALIWVLVKLIYSNCNMINVC